MHSDSETTRLKRHYNPAETKPHHYGQGAVQRIFKFENGHPAVSVIPVRIGNGIDGYKVLLDRFEAATGPSGDMRVLAYNIDEAELQELLDACAGATGPCTACADLS